jgi:Flp pilus assembly pilin Flp
VKEFYALTVTLYWRNKKGQDLVEYALMAGFMAVTVAAVIPDVSTGISKVFSSVIGSLGLQATSSLIGN